MGGGWFWVAGMDMFNREIDRDFIMKEDNCTGSEGSFNRTCYLPRNLFLPPAKDTVVVPPGGYVILMIELTNKGTWLFHCHINYHLSTGMAMVLQIGGVTEQKNTEQ